MYISIEWYVINQIGVSLIQRKYGTFYQHDFYLITA